MKLKKIKKLTRNNGCIQLNCTVTEDGSNIRQAVQLMTCLKNTNEVDKLIEIIKAQFKERYRNVEPFFFHAYRFVELLNEIFCRTYLNSLPPIIHAERQRFNTDGKRIHFNSGTMETFVRKEPGESVIIILDAHFSHGSRWYIKRDCEMDPIGVKWDKNLGRFVDHVDAAGLNSLIEKEIAHYRNTFRPVFNDIAIYIY